MTPGETAFAAREAAAERLAQARRAEAAARAALPERLRLLAAEREFEEAHAAAAAVCEHPASYVAEYPWEHDNGYGRQATVTGERCTLCGSHRSWKGVSGWWKR